MDTAHKYHLNCWVPRDVEAVIRQRADRTGLSISAVATTLLLRGIEASKKHNSEVI